LGEFTVAVQNNTILGKYRVIREIARSNDIVYEGVDPSMGRRVAIKELAIPQHLSGSQKRERIERFYREAKAAGTLSHPNIVTIYDVGQEGERHFIVMEYLEGHSLREIQQMQGALPVKESLEIALQLCDALGYAHSRGIVHRDVKPDNIHILPGGVIKLTDFGIARITAEPSITAHGQVFGTPSYMSPEQVASHTVDHRTDIFSMGITLYEMLTGRKPFAGDSVITITYNIMNIQPPMPTGVPPGMHSILQKGLAKDVNFRYQNAAAMAADIRAEKFALESGNKTAQMQGMQMPAGGFSGSMNTGTVPPEISGIPAFAPGQVRYGANAPATNQGYPPPPQQPGRPYPTQYPGYAPDNRQGSMSSETKNVVVLALSVAGILILLGLIIWGLSVAFQRNGGHSSSRGVQTISREGTVASSALITLDGLRS
jgi:serine/threonine protein kinase